MDILIATFAYLIFMIIVYACIVLGGPLMIHALVGRTIISLEKIGPMEAAFWYRKSKEASKLGSDIWHYWKLGNHVLQYYTAGTES